MQPEVVTNAVEVTGAAYQSDKSTTTDAGAASSAIDQQQQQRQEFKQKEKRAKKQQLHDVKRRGASGGDGGVSATKQPSTKKTRNGRIKQLADSLRSIQTAVPFYEREHISLIKCASLSRLAWLQIGDCCHKAGPLATVSGSSGFAIQFKRSKMTITGGTADKALQGLFQQLGGISVEW